MRKVMVLALCLSLAASFALAREATLTRVDMDIMGEMMRDDADCVIGNNDLDNILGYLGAWWTGFEDLAYQVYPYYDCGEICVDGWSVRSISMLVALAGQYDELLIGATLYAGGHCNITFPRIVSTNTVTITDTDVPLGYYIITIPFQFQPGDPCPITGNAIYAPHYLGINFLSGLGYYDGPPSEGGNPMLYENWVGIPVTNGPVSCKNWNDWGGGWVDLVEDYSWPGNLMIWAEIDCCDGSVSTEDSSLSEIKQLFR